MTDRIFCSILCLSALAQAASGQQRSPEFGSDTEAIADAQPTNASALRVWRGADGSQWVAGQGGELVRYVPSPLQSWETRIQYLAWGGGVAADWFSTRQAIDRYNAREANPVLGCGAGSLTAQLQGAGLNLSGCSSPHDVNRTLFVVANVVPLGGWLFYDLWAYKHLPPTLSFFGRQVPTARIVNNVRWGVIAGKFGIAGWNMSIRYRK